MSKVKADDNVFRFIYYEILPWVMLILSSLAVLLTIYVGIRSCFETKPTDEDEDDSEDLKIRTFNKYKKYKSCSICLHNFKKTSKLCVLPCKHAFHAKCIVHWFKTDQITCPNCRRVVSSLERARSEAEYELLNDYRLDPLDIVRTPLVCNECVEICKIAIQNVEFSMQIGSPVKIVLVITERTRSYYAHLSRGQLSFSNHIPRLASTVTVLPIAANFLTNCRHECLQDDLEEIEREIAESQRIAAEELEREEAEALSRIAAEENSFVSLLN